MNTTLNKIRDKSPCVDGWTKLLKYLGKTRADDAPLSIKTVLESNGLNDALWCLRAVEGRDKEIRLLAVKYARAVQHLMTPQSVRLLDVAESYANGQATLGELPKARGAAWDSVRAAGGACATRAAWAAARGAYWIDSVARYARDAARLVEAKLAGANAAKAARSATKAQQTQDLLDLCNQLEKTCTSH